MDWVNELSDLYEKNQNLAGKMTFMSRKTKKGEERIPLVLLPVFHTTVTAQITVTINEKGEFLRGDFVDNDDKLTIIPVTEKSGSRTAGKEAHPLCDNIRYLAGDYVKYAQMDEKNPEVYYKLYMEGLSKWHYSSYSHEKTDSIYQYLSKGCLVSDLVREAILKLDENQRLSTDFKIQNIEQSKAFVRFRVEKEWEDKEAVLEDTEGRFLPECWMDQTLQQSFIKYYQSLSTKKALCYLSGNIEQISFLHSKKIRNEGDNAKLLSSNDAENFTYRGRFSHKEQAVAIGIETSQKIHNALKWIIRQQGRSWDSFSLVTWESDLKAMPSWEKDTDRICDDYEGDTWGEEEEEENHDGNPMEAQRFQKALMGYRTKLEQTSRMILMSFDSATTGRLALTEYKSLESSRYLNNIQYWHESGEWIQTKYKSGKLYSFLGMTGVSEIAELLYGTEQNGFLSLNGKNKMYAEVYKRLIPCIWERREIPIDMVNRAVERASSPMTFEKRYNWEKEVSLACSLIKKQRKERKKEEWTVALDTECGDRSYLYGRLLAVADRVEYLTFDREGDGGRQTNAKRYMTMFSQRPFSTWKVIEESLEPYFQKLSRNQRIHYEELIDTICNKFCVKDFEDNRKLDGLYLLGFHSQSFAFRKDKDTEAEGRRDE